MTKYFWDLDLEQIPLGWEDAYHDALHRCPDGEIIGAEFATGFHRLFYHPVKCRQLLLDQFNFYKKQAIEIMNQKDSLDFKVLVSELVRIDVILYEVLVDWLMEDKDGSNFDPSKLIEPPDYAFYFDYNDEYPKRMAEFIHLKMIRFPR